MSRGALPKASTAGRSALPREVRIVGGQWKRSKLPVTDSAGLRPTPDRVRETLFNWLGHDLSGWRCLDAFAGSGALGFEAASRGASQVVLLERDRHLAKSLQQTAERLNATMTVRVECAEALAWMARSAAAQFEAVFIDPPFDSDLLAPAVLAASRLVVPDGLVYAELSRELSAEDVAGAGLQISRSSRAGAVHFHLLRRTAGA
ncbi:MAG: 16S rRNA (guanine(966)-N(2))-methyltransferase RsmD [Pseudomonadota bacterium]|nr:16S rRNA (guanine(966)-N(2))-methyltransferase RsmD [Pseudomonadota bacterium]